MRLPSNQMSVALASSLLLIAATPAAAADAQKLPCSAVEVDGHTFDLSALKGPHVVVTSEFAPPSYYNRTYAIDLCAPLVRKGEVEGRFKCPDGTHGMCFFLALFFPVSAISSWIGVLKVECQADVWG
jgi:autophagy-related protein 27